MKLTRHPSNPILSQNPVNPWEAGSVLNPSVLYDNGIFRMVYRATNDIHLDKKGKFMSSIGYAESTDGIHFTRFVEPIIVADKEYEKRFGCEDPRVTKINDTYFLYYTAVGGERSGEGVRIALATSKDFKNWEKHGIVGPQFTYSKASCLFPEKINGKYTMLYTWKADSPLSSILMAQFETITDVLKPPKGTMANNIDHYEDNVIFEPPANVFRGAEVGAVPVKTKEGWLFIYCGANVSDHPEWTINAALLDFTDPRKILADIQLLRPETKEERSGLTNNVTFPEGAVIVGEDLYVYYGSGDQGICLATCKVKDLLKEFTSLIKKSS